MSGINSKGWQEWGSREGAPINGVWGCVAEGLPEVGPYCFHEPDRSAVVGQDL